MTTEAKPEYSPGLAGVIAGETAICWVDPNAGLMYRGYDIHEMGDKATFEEVAYLLLNGELPNGKQLNEFNQQIASPRDLPKEILEMLKGEVPEAGQTRVLDRIINLYADHEFNASTFAARVTASTLAGIYAAVTSACGTLKGALHGGANEESMKMLEEIKTPDRAEDWLKKQLAAKAKIMGFGHRVYKKGDSRVPVMREIGRDLGKRTGKERWILICEKLEEVMDS